MATFKLAVDDALAIAAAISDPSEPDEVTRKSTGTLKIIVSKNGCRRVDVVKDVPGVKREHAWMKRQPAWASSFGVAAPPRPGVGRVAADDPLPHITAPPRSLRSRGRKKRVASSASSPHAQTHGPERQKIERSGHARARRRQDCSYPPPRRPLQAVR